MRKETLLIALAIALVLTTSACGGATPEPTATAKLTNTPEPTDTSVPTNTPAPTNTPKPTPTPASYYPEAKKLVLEVPDLPDGYKLEKENTNPLTIDGKSIDGVVGTYEVGYARNLVIVYNRAAVFESIQEAQDYIQQRKQSWSDDPAVEFIPGPALGDEIIASKTNTTTHGINVTVYGVVLRKRNMIEALATGGMPSMVTFDTLPPLAEKALDKINDQIGD